MALAAAACCAGCTSSTTPSLSPGSTAISSVTVLGAGITVVQGQNFTIQLQSNPSTGYHWEPIYNSSYIKLVNRAFASGVSANPLVVGASGTDTFTFQGTKQGTSIITFDNISLAYERANSLSYTIVITS